MKTLLLLCLLSGQDVDEWIRNLGADDLEVREAAEKRLVEEGEAALPALQRALGDAKGDPRLRIEAVIARIERAALDKKIKIEIDLPADPPTLKAIRRERETLALKITNDSDREVVLFAYAPMSIQDAAGKEVETSMDLGRWGSRAKECFLEEQEGMFLTVPARSAKELRFGIASYMLHPDSITGWKLPKAGTYQLQLHLKFDRAAFVDGCRCAAASHKDPKRVWNRAVELDRRVEAKLEVAP